MDFIMENWAVFVAALAVLAVAIIAIVRFAGLPTASQLAKVKEWLLWAVTEAEKDLGGGTWSVEVTAGLRPVRHPLPLAGQNDFV